MGASRPEELIAWRLAHDLKLAVYEITDRSTVRRDFGFCHQIREAAASGEDNIAEGFWRYTLT
jgi:four helix bundle protein